MDGAEILQLFNLCSDKKHDDEISMDIARA